MEEGSRRLSDLVNVRHLQDILDDSARAMGFAFVTVDYRGAPVTEYSGFTSHCQMMRRYPQYSALCEQCDAHGGLQAAITGQPSIYLCHAGLMDFAVPLIANGTYIGAILGGQVRLADDDRQLMPIIPNRVMPNRQTPFQDEFSATSLASYDKVLSTINILQNMLPSSLRPSESSFEIAPGRRELSMLRRRDTMRYFFFAMNIIARTAASENAHKTEGAIYDFSDMMRYAADSAHSVSTIGEELNYIRLMDRMMGPWAADAIKFKIDVSEEIRSLQCPFMVMQPIVENAIYGSGDILGTVREIEIEGVSGSDAAIISIKIKDDLLTPEMMTSRLSATLDDDRLTMSFADAKMKRMYGDGYGLRIERRRDGVPGCEIIVRVPAKGRKRSR